MFYNLSDTRQPLENGNLVVIDDSTQYVIDRYIGCGGFSLMYIAHLKNSSRYVALKELFPKTAESGVVVRREDGKIVIYDPLAENVDADHSSELESMAAYFEREVKLTQKAGLVFNSSGKEDVQNSPDVLHISGPFRDEKGNLYIAVDTAQGETLGALISRGFLKNDDNEVVANGNLEDILAVLKDTTRLLSKLHGDNHMLHLDLSPDNIYVTKSAGVRPTPHIIDYGSAYDKKDPNEQAAHQFTCNPYSAPEVIALAELNDQSCGYQPTEASDTYAVVSILFYAATGKTYSPKMLFQSRWKEQIRDGYSPELYGAEGEAFAEKLLSFFETGLSSDPSQRFASANELHAELSALQKSFKAYGNLLSLIEPDELMSYAVLEKKPLYHYKSESGNLDVLCLGSGVFVKRMILSLLSCGQMIGSNLNIHVVSAEPENVFRGALLDQAPALADYSNLVKDCNEFTYVSFTYVYEPDLLQPERCAEIVKSYGFCRYVIISLGSNNKNFTLAQMYGKYLSDISTGGKTIIHYYMAEDAAMNVRSETDMDILSTCVELSAFGIDNAAYAKDLRSLGRRTLKLSYLYEKLANPCISLQEAAQKLAQDAYGQRSSCASALHLKYKLASIGINPAPSTNHKAIISAYLKKLQDPKSFGALLELEHRRWMMYMFADSWQLPAIEQIDAYSFRETKAGFNDSFKDTMQKLHPCLVPCGIEGIRLQHLSHDVWDKFDSNEKIIASDYDPLDKMSLTLHLLAKKKINRSVTGDTMKAHLQNEVGAMLDQWEIGLAADDSKGRTDRLRTQYDQVAKSLADLVSTGQYSGEREKVALLELVFEEAGIDAAAGFQHLQDDLKLYIEYVRYRDYKSPDATIIENLPWLLYSDDGMTLIKLAGRTVSDNITGPLIMEPKKLIYFGKTPDDNLTAFLRAHGNRGVISFVPCREMDADSVYQELVRLKHKLPGRCVIDITGGDELHVAAAIRLSQLDRQISIVRSKEATQEIENICGFHRAAAYRLNTKISASEVYSLYGAQEIASSNQYMLKMGRAAKTLWMYYREFQNEWEMVTAFFHSRGSGTPELRFKYNKTNNGFVQWRNYTTIVDEFAWTSLNIKESFSCMENVGFIRNMTAIPTGRRGLTVSFQYPGNAPEQKNDFAFKGFNNFFKKKMWYALSPFVCKVAGNQDSDMYISLESGSSVEIYDQKGIDYADKRHQNEGGGKRFAYTSVVPALQRLEEIGLICDLFASPDMEQTPISIRYAYTDLAVKDCLMTAGNVLELYAWHAAVQTGYFDDCKANFSFRWKEGIKNELDLILMKGLTALAVSCKTAKFKKEHLYEVKYLTDRFSLNSKAVIVYSSMQAVEEDGRLTNDTSAVKERAKSMGIYLIDMNELDSPDQLGGIFEKIAKDGQQIH